MLFKKVTIICLLTCAFALFYLSNARAQTLASAKILSSTGAVEIHRPSQAQGLMTQISYSVNDELFAGDVIRTLKGGRLVLGLMDGSQAIVGELTTLEILDLTKSPRTIFNVLRGKTRIKIEKVGGRPNPYRVNTPTTVIAVRGTMFDVIVTSKETQVFVHEGEVSVTNLVRPDATIILSPGLRTRVLPAQPPEPPVRFQPGRNDDKFNPNGLGREGNNSRRPPARDNREGERRRQAEPSTQDQTQPVDGQKQGPPPPPPPPNGRPNSEKRDESKNKRGQFFANHG